LRIFTIGFSQKSAEGFFTLLKENEVKKLIDIRLNNKSQLAGFANVKHLPYLLKIHGIEYEYKSIFAPTKELLDGYKKGDISWDEYEKIFNKILEDRKVLEKINIKDFENAVLLCSEPTAEHCHRRLTVEYLQKNFENIEIKHL